MNPIELTIQCDVEFDRKFLTENTDISILVTDLRYISTVFIGRFDPSITYI